MIRRLAIQSLASVIALVMINLVISIHSISQTMPSRREISIAPALNILLILVDDLAAELGTYGNPIVKSPNIDALAERGMRFDRAYTQYTLCNPSRTSFLTGLYPGITGVRSNRRWFRDLRPDAISMPQYFRSNGYVTVRTGKVFHDGY